MPYDRAKNWRDTQSDITKLFGKHEIGDTQWSVSDTQQKMALSFVKRIKGKRIWNREAMRLDTTKPEQQITVRLTLPLKPDGPERNKAFRVLYWYLKSKLEAIAFRFNDGTEYFNFEREFFGNVVIEDAHGRPAEAFDAFKAGNVELAAADRIIALTGAK